MENGICADDGREGGLVYFCWSRRADGQVRPLAPTAWSARETKSYALLHMPARSMHLPDRRLLGCCPCLITVIRVHGQGRLMMMAQGCNPVCGIRRYSIQEVADGEAHASSTINQSHPSSMVMTHDSSHHHCDLDDH